MPDPVSTFFAEHPLVETVDLLLPDLVGIFRGKRLNVAELQSALDGHSVLSTTLDALDTTGANVDESGLVWEEGDADRPLVLDPETIRPISWRPDRA